MTNEQELISLSISHDEFLELRELLKTVQCALSLTDADSYLVEAKRMALKDRELIHKICGEGGYKFLRGVI